MAYLTPQETIAYVGSEIVSDAPFLARCVAAAEAAVDDFCRRNFNPPVAPPDTVTRRYRPRGDFVVIHDIVDDDDLTITDNGSAVDLGDVQLEPLNNLSSAGLVVPFSKIRRLGQCWSTPSRTGEASVEVTSTRWGWASVPSPVKEATAILAKDLAHVKGTRFGVAGFDGFGAVRVRDNPHVKMLLDRPDLVHPSAKVLVG